MPEPIYRYGLPGLLAVGLGLAVIACDAEPAISDLNTEGLPRVITVTVLSESRGEAATYCAGEEFGEKLNASYCPGEGKVTDAAPLGWELRVIFNELLLGDAVEDLVPVYDNAGNEVATRGTLVNTQPVIVTCAGEDVVYDGYYQPTGNHLTDPAGPALVIHPILPDGFVATGTQDCEATVKDKVLAKSFETMDPDRRGPFGFGIAPLGVVVDDKGNYKIAPANGADKVVLAPEITIEFNAYVDSESLTGTVALVKTADDSPVAVSTAVDGAIVTLTPVDPLEISTQYTVRVTSGVRDVAGVELVLDAPAESSFTTGDGSST